MAKLELMKAARTMLAAYDNSNASDVKVSVNINGVQAAYLKNGILVIPGTNEASDWAEFNFNVWSGDSGALWHAGFLRHAQIVFSFAKPLKPKFIIGHSLGGASAQIVGSSLKTPTITFGAPRVYKESSPVSGEGWVLNICRSDDSVCHVPPPLLGFRHIGSRRWLLPDKLNPGEDHRMDKYIHLLGRKSVAKNLPAAWPV